MIALTRPLVVLDTETTGVGDQDRVIELGFQVYEGVFPGEPKETARSLINPGVPIPAESTAIHGITDADMLGCRVCGRLELGHPFHCPPMDNPIEGGPSIICVCEKFHPVPYFRQVAVKLAQKLSGCDFAGKNVRFDLRKLSWEFALAEVPWHYADARIIDIDRLEAWLNKRSLSHLYRKYTGKKHEKAHGALGDVEASVVVLTAQLLATSQHEDEPAPLPRDLAALHALQWPGWIDTEGKFRFVNGVPCFSGWGKYANQPMRKADVGYWDFILTKDFSLEVKMIAGRAKLGQFPEEVKP